MGEQRSGSAVRGWLVAIIGLVAAALLGWALMAIGAKRLEDARKIRAESEGRLMVAVDFAAREAMREAQDAQMAVNSSNWGEAGSRLSRVNELVTLMEQVAAEGERRAVGDVRNRLGEAQRSVGQQSKEAGQSVSALVTALDVLREKKTGQ